MNRVPLLVLAPLLALACSKGVEPKDVSAVEHEQIAQREEQAADAHDLAIAQAAGPHASGPEYAERAKADQQQANRHRENAAKHRAVAQELRAGEAQACAGIAEEERVINPFGQREDITSVSVIEERPAPALDAPEEERTAGARIVIRAEPAMTVEYLQRTVDCYIARTSTGPVTPEMASSPLALKDIEATVESTGSGFAVNVKSDDRKTVQEIIRRADALAK